jgi:hypothetical protein
LLALDRLQPVDLALDLALGVVVNKAISEGLLLGRLGDTGELSILLCLLLLLAQLVIERNSVLKILYCDVACRLESLIGDLQFTHCSSGRPFISGSFGFLVSARFLR